MANFYQHTFDIISPDFYNRLKTLITGYYKSVLGHFDGATEEDTKIGNDQKTYHVACVRVVLLVLRLEA